MRIVVTGREGQVVRSLLERGPTAGHEIVALGRPQLDLAGDPDRISEAVEHARPDVIVSAAAYTAVDRAESEPDLAFAINASGPEALGRAARRLGVPLIHLSTDYVFDGSKPEPYVEQDHANPATAYGASKLAGERAVLAAHEDVAVLRTAWVYSPFGANFVKSILALAHDRDEVAVVADQRGNPTNALDIAEGILTVAASLANFGDRSKRGIFHMTGTGDASWADLAEEIFRAAATEGRPTCRVRRVSSLEFPTVAKRPANSRLNSDKLARIHGVRLADWHESLAPVVARLVGSLD